MKKILLTIVGLILSSSVLATVAEIPPTPTECLIFKNSKLINRTACSVEGSYGGDYYSSFSEPVHD